MKRIAVFTSGGDSPGMNACIRAVVRTCAYNQVEAIGIKRGYEGMIEGDFVQLPPSAVSNIIHLGGTILKTARSSRFLTQEGRKLAFLQLQKHRIEGLVVIGGDGSFKGAETFYAETGMPVIGIPGTIDNDLVGTDFTLGFDTAINTALSAIDKIRDTAASHNRLFFIEVMGRDAGFIALYTGIASGSEAILVPETITDIEQLIKLLETGWNRQKSSCIIIVAEGDDAGGAFEVAQKVKERFNHYDTRVSILGHIQRGGSPSCQDRVLAARLGVAAVEALLNRQKNEMVGLINNQITFTPLTKAVKSNHLFDPNLLRMVEILSV